MKGIVYNNNILAGTIEKEVDGSYIFVYNDEYLANKEQPPISLTLLKSQKEHRSQKMFPFFYGLLSEGINKDIQCRLYKIDENDDFTRLLLSARYDTIGSVTVKPEDDDLLRMLY